jgi:hypothetical protein
MSKILNFPIIPRPFPVAPEPEEDAAVAMLKAIDRCEKKLGKRVTAIVIARRYQLADTIANTFNWRERARQLIDRKETQV